MKKDILIEYFLGRDAKEMMDHLNKTVPKDKLALIKRGLTGSLVCMFIYGFAIGGILVLLLDLITGRL